MTDPRPKLAKSLDAARREHEHARAQGETAPPTSLRTHLPDDLPSVLRVS